MNYLDIEITVLQEISSAIVRNKDVHALLDKVLRILSTRLRLSKGAFTFLYGDELRVDVSHGLSLSEKDSGIYYLGDGLTSGVLQSGEVVSIADISKDPNFHTAESARYICVPAFYNGENIGILSVSGSEASVAPAFLEIVANITAEAVAAILRDFEEKQTLMEENRQLRDMLTGNTHIIGNSRPMREIYGQIKQVAPSDATVLLRGSSGTGKELVARAIVELSSRKNKPLITLNCASIPENLVESELFGHEKGAFTGAVQRRIGRAEAADGGTLFLDEIGDLSLMAQVKLLRFIQERTFSRVGSSEELKSDVRFIAATSRNLEELITKGKFREDLFYRLNIYPINMPDLVDRKTDIIQLSEHFIEKYNLKYNKSVARLSTPAINMLMAYHWPGNVRELENCIERAIITATDDCIRSYNLPPSLQTDKSSGTELVPEGQASFNILVDSFEKELIVEALKRNNGNMSAAARSLGLSPRVIHYKINRLGINPAIYAVNKAD